MIFCSTRTHQQQSVHFHTRKTLHQQLVISVPLPRSLFHRNTCSDSCGMADQTMPHTSHKKGKSQDKRRNVPGEDGWTHVARGPPAGFPNPNSTDENRKRTFDVDEPRRGLTVENMQEHDVQIVARWEKTAMYAHLVRYFEHHILKLDHLRITSCVCVGLGNLTTYFGRPDTCLTQLAALETMLNILGNFSPVPILGMNRTLTITRPKTYH